MPESVGSLDYVLCGACTSTVSWCRKVTTQHKIMKEYIVRSGGGGGI